MGYRQRCSWRHRLKPWKPKRFLKAGLWTALLLECSFGAGQFIFQRLDQIHIVKMEDTVRVEWFAPTPEDLQGTQDSCGILFRWNEGEVRFYRSSQQINGH